MRHAKTLVVVLAVAWLAVAPAMAAEKNVTGTWKCVSKAEGQGSMEFKLELVQKGSTVTGSASRTDGSTEIRKGSFEDGKLKLAIEADGGTYEMEASLDADKLTGTVSHSSGIKANWEGTREGAAAAAGADADLLGTWRTKVSLSGQTIEYNLEFKREGETLVGIITLDSGENIKLSKVAFADKTLKFTVTVGEGDYQAEGTLDGNTLKGFYVAPGGGKDNWEATKRT